MAHVDLSIDGGRSWKSAQLGTDEGKYGFRRWQAQFTLPVAGRAQMLMIRCTNTNGETQPDFPVWNPAGYMRNTMTRFEAAKYKFPALSSARPLTMPSEASRAGPGMPGGWVPPPATVVMVPLESMRRTR